MRILALIFSALLLTGCNTTTLMTIKNHKAPTYNEKFTMEEMEKSIRGGANRNGWETKVIKPGHIFAELHLRTHYAAVDIYHDTDSYSIEYNDSNELKYNAEKGTIHRGYNRWVLSLQKTIDQQVRMERGEFY